MKGPKARKFVNLVLQGWWGSRNTAAEKFTKDTSLPAFELCGMDEILFDKKQNLVLKTQ